MIDETMPLALMKELQENSASVIAADEFNANREAEAGYTGYQLIRNVLAAYAAECSFCLLYTSLPPKAPEWA